MHIQYAYRSPDIYTVWKASLSEDAQAHTASYLILWKRIDAKYRLRLTIVSSIESVHCYSCICIRRQYSSSQAIIFHLQVSAYYTIITQSWDNVANSVWKLYASIQVSGHENSPNYCQVYVYDHSHVAMGCYIILWQAIERKAIALIHSTQLIIHIRILYVRSYLT